MAKTLEELVDEIKLHHAKKEKLQQIFSALCKMATSHSDPVWKYVESVSKDRDAEEAAYQAALTAASALVAPRVDWMVIVQAKNELSDGFNYVDVVGPFSSGDEADAWVAQMQAGEVVPRHYTITTPTKP
jgi:hypothetical protein